MDPKESSNANPATKSAPTKPAAGQKSGYGKRPLWQWILIYLVIAGILYYAIYYFFLRSSYKANSPSASQQHSLY